MEELNIDALLEQFRDQGFERGEKVILGYFGTVQSLLSLIFDTVVTVHLHDQRTQDGEIVRNVTLLAGEVAVCNALSRIPEVKNRRDVIDDISAGNLGLGQIVVKYQIPTLRYIEDVGRDAIGFWRDYVIAGPSLRIRINEFFERKPFEDVGWLDTVVTTVVKAKTDEIGSV